MKKRIITGLIVSFLCAFSFIGVNAASNPTVTFDGTSTLKYSEDANNFSQVFQGMHAGESRTLNIDLVNKSDKDVDFFMKTEILNSLEEGMAANGAGYHVSLKLIKGSNETYIFGSDEGALVGANENGLYDLNGALNENYLITALDANEEATLALTIVIDGATARNEYQATTGEIQFDFSVSYEESIATNIINRVVTGDPTTVSMLIAVLLIAGATIYVSAKKLKGDKS